MRYHCKVLLLVKVNIVQSGHENLLLCITVELLKLINYYFKFSTVNCLFFHFHCRNDALQVNLSCQKISRCVSSLRIYCWSVALYLLKQHESYKDCVVLKVIYYIYLYLAHLLF